MTIDMETKALELVSTLFKNTYDKGGNPYIEHLKSVAKKLNTKEEKTVALLHDVIEDTNLSAKDLLDLGFTDEIVDAVTLVSRIPEDSYTSFIAKIVDSDNILAISVKIADLEDNMNLTRIKEITKTDLKRVNNRYKPSHAKLTNKLKILTQTESHIGSSTR